MIGFMETLRRALADAREGGLELQFAAREVLRVEVLEAVRSSFAELQQWMHWAQTIPTREKQREALIEGNTAFDAGTDFGFLFRETATGALVGGGGVAEKDGGGGHWSASHESGSTLRRSAAAGRRSAGRAGPAACW